MNRLLMVLCVWFTVAGGVHTESVTVYAAASLTGVLEDLATLAREEGGTVKLSFGSSSTLAKQIARGAPADVYVSANTAWMDHLQGEGHLEAGSRVDLASNAMVVIAPRDEPFRLSILSGDDLGKSFDGRLAIGDPDHVPAGMYARQALAFFGWWKGVADRLAPTVDVRGALAFVERGECAAGIVYATDAAASDRVVVVTTFPDRSHDPVVYPAAVVKGRRTSAVSSFFALLQSERARQTFERYGFRPSPSLSTD